MTGGWGSFSLIMLCGDAPCPHPQMLQQHLLTSSDLSVWKAMLRPLNVTDVYTVWRTQTTYTQKNLGSAWGCKGSVQNVCSKCTRPILILGTLIRCSKCKYVPHNLCRDLPVMSVPQRRKATVSRKLKQHSSFPVRIAWSIRVIEKKLYREICKVRRPKWEKELRWKHSLIHQVFLVHKSTNQMIIV